MPAQLRHRFVPPAKPDAEPICSLDTEATKRRKESPEALLAAAVSQKTGSEGTEFRFAAKPGIWDRVSTFVDEEQECCPFLAFEQWEEAGEVVLRIFQPKQANDG